MKKMMTSILVMVIFSTFTMSTVGAFTPSGLAKKGGLPPGLQNKDELPPGIQKRFIDYEESLLGRSEYEAVIEDIDTTARRITIKQGTALISLFVDNKASIALNGKEVELKNLKKNDEVYLKLDKNYTIIEVKAISSEERTSISEGTIKWINYRSREVILQHDDREVLYTINEDAIIKVNAVTTTIRSIKEDMKVEVKLRDKDILEMNGIDETNTYEGRLIAKDTSKNPTITILIDGKNKTFDVDSNLNLSRVNVGRNIRIYVENNVVLRILQI